DSAVPDGTLETFPESTRQCLPGYFQSRLSALLFSKTQPVTCVTLRDASTHAKSGRYLAPSFYQLYIGIPLPLETHNAKAHEVLYRSRVSLGSLVGSSSTCKESVSRGGDKSQACSRSRDPGFVFRQELHPGCRLSRRDSGCLG